MVDRTLTDGRQRPVKLANAPTVASLNLRFAATTGEHRLELAEDTGLTTLALAEALLEAARRFYVEHVAGPPVDLDALDQYEYRTLVSMYEGRRYSTATQTYTPQAMDSLIERGLVGVARRLKKQPYQECFVPINFLPPQPDHPGLPPEGMKR